MERTETSDSFEWVVLTTSLGTAPCLFRSSDRPAPGWKRGVGVCPGVGAVCGAGVWLGTVQWVPVTVLMQCRHRTGVRMRSVCDLGGQ